jgi:hypothetical protein
LKEGLLEPCIWLFGKEILLNSSLSIPYTVSSITELC